MTRPTILLAALLAAAPAVAQDDGPVMYVSQFRIQSSRLDSLVTLIRTYDLPWQAAISEAVPGYQRWYYRHDTGDDFNLVIATLYPNWDMIRGDEIDHEAIWTQFRARLGFAEGDENQVNAMFEWAYEGSSHVDNIYSPITAGD